MSGIYLKTIVRILLVALCLLQAPALWAESESAKKEDEEDGTDVVLLLDSSGSMRLTDPDRMRDDGAKVLFQYLKPGDRLGIIQFDEVAQVQRPLSALGEDEQRIITDQIADIENEGLFTDLHAGVKAAIQMLKDSGEQGSKVIVMFSDGKMDPNPEVGKAEVLAEELLEEILPKISEDGIKLYTLAFSKESDKELLKKMALATDGVGIYAEKPSDIQDAFSELFLAVKKPQILPLRGKGFEIDSAVSEATFYIKNEDAEYIVLQTPRGTELSRDSYPKGVSWYEGKHFEVITVQAPEVGQWSITGISNTDGFATVLTNLKLQTDWPSSLLAGSKRLLTARLFDGKKPVVLPSMSDTARFFLQVTPTDKVSEPVIRELLHDDGTHGDEKAQDGVFSTIVNLEEPGQYKLQVSAKSPTFERQQQIPFRVKDRLVSLEVVPVEVLDAEKAGQTRDFFRVKLGSETVTFQNVEVKLTATTVGEEKRVFALPVEQSQENSLRYEVPAAVLPEDGKYTLKASLSAISKKKKPVRSDSQIIAYEKVTTEFEESHPELSVVVAKEQKKEEKPQPILPYAILVTLVNAGVGAFAFITLKKSQSQMTFSTPKYEPGEELLAAIASLEELSQLTEIAPDDPRLLDTSIPEPPDFEAVEEASTGDEAGAGGDSEEVAGESEDAAEQADGEEAEVEAAEGAGEGSVDEDGAGEDNAEQDSSADEESGDAEEADDNEDEEVKE